MENNVIERINSLINARGCSQASFARQCNIGVSNLSKMMNGKETITERTLLRIAETFSINLDWLRKGIGEMYRKDTEKANAQYAQLVALLGDRVQANTIHGDNNTGTQSIHAADSSEVELLKQKVAMLEEMLKDKDRQIAEKESYITRLMDMFGKQNNEQR